MPRQQSIAEYVEENVQQTLDMGMINQLPIVNYDLPSTTAFLVFQNLLTGGITFEKVVLNGTLAYIATANFSPQGGNDRILTDMKQMVSSFTLIGK